MTPAQYFVMDAQNPKRMLLQSLRNPNLRNGWLLGRRFTTPPSPPVVVGIIAGYEKAEILPFFATPPVATDAFYQALVDAGVDNLEAFEAVLRSEDGKTEYRGFKALNVIGLVRAADLANTRFDVENESRLIDASIDRLAIDSAKAHGLMLFRLAEYSGAIVVHAKVKRAIEARGFPHVIFREPKDFIS